MWFLLVSSLANAQDSTDLTVPAIDAQIFHHSVDATHTLWTDDSGTAPMAYFGAKLGVNYAMNPISYVDSEGTKYGVLTDAFGLDVIGRINVWRFRLGVDVPIYPTAGGDVSGGQAGLGDVAVDVKATILDPTDKVLGLAVVGRLGLPSGNIDGLSSHGLGYEVDLVGDIHFGNGLIAANVGHRGLPEVMLDDVQWGDQLAWRVGAGYGFTEAVGASLDVGGYISYPIPAEASVAPAEGLLGLWVKPTKSLVLRAGGGSGIGAGVGAPDFRGIFSIAYEPPHIRDLDGDGIVDKQDSCPSDKEDFDGYKDADGCPDLTTRVAVSFVDDSGQPVPGVKWSVAGPELTRDGADQLAFEVHPNDYRVKAEADGYASVDSKLSIPDRASYKTQLEMRAIKGRVAIRVIDVDGNPVEATIRLGQAPPFETKEGKRAVSTRPGDYVIQVLADGYKPVRDVLEVVDAETTTVTIKVEKAKAKMTKEKIEILEKVYFDTNKATIKAESFGLLDDVASLLQAYPDIKLLSVEGHTDSRGSASANKRLSQARAESVMEYLVKAGISPTRLQAAGYGPERPIDPARNAAAYEKNRRVEFVILERDMGDTEE